MSATVPNARISDIVRQIRGAALPFLGSNQARIDAKDALDGASAALTGTRESILLALADLSMRGQWTASEVKSAAKAAADLSNNESEKALATFIGETKRAMSPKVRMHVERMIQVRDLAWEAEKLAKDEDKDTPTPLRKAFARGYHCLIQMMGEAEEGNVIDDVPGLLAFARAKDPDLDLEKVNKRLQAIREQLAKFYHDWPVDGIKDCMEFLDEIDTKALKTARATVTKNDEARLQKHNVGPLPASLTHEADEEHEDHEEPVSDDVEVEEPEEHTTDVLEDILAA